MLGPDSAPRGELPGVSAPQREGSLRLKPNQLIDDVGVCSSAARLRVQEGPKPADWNKDPVQSRSFSLGLKGPVQLLIQALVKCCFLFVDPSDQNLVLSTLWTRSGSVTEHVLFS